MNRSMNYRYMLGLILLLAVLVAVASASKQPVRGVLQGRVIDIDTKLPLTGANIVLVGSQYGASSDLDGNFTIDYILVGSYVVQCTFLGYEPVLIPDVIIKPERTTQVYIELHASALDMVEVTVKPNYFSQAESEPVSATDLTYEEIRRTPGAAGDISRIMMALPSVAKVNDTRNSLVVRGGSPTENGYYVDNIGIPNINHFPLQGASSGAMGLLNVDFIKDVHFYTGGFNAAYGDRLSSITDINFREGDRVEFAGQVDLSMQGFGAVAEGPLPGRKGSWMLSARRSYWDLIVDAFEVEASTVPEIVDFQTKVVYDLSDRHQLSVLDVMGVDESVIEKATSIENEENNYGNADWVTNALGLNWRYLWGGMGYSNTSLSHSLTDWDSRWYETRTDQTLTETKSTEQNIWLRNSNHLVIDPAYIFDFGVESQIIGADYDDFFGAYSDLLGNPTPELHVQDNISSYKAAAFASCTWKPHVRLSTTYGVRLDYFDYTENAYVSPRFQFVYQLDLNTRLTGSYGQFYQFLPLVLLSQSESFKSLDDPRADHYVLGISHLLTENTRFTIEGYAKEYHNAPLDPDQPSLFIIDESNDQGGFAAHQRLAGSGAAYTRGVEVMIQKKLAYKLYGLISGSYFRSRYRGYDGVWRDRLYDNRYMFTVEGGYKPNSKWEFSLRWVYAGGAPYTPFDQEASKAANRGIYDSEQINSERLPDYHSMNLRVDRRFHFKTSNLILYLSVWNVYGRENVASYYWNEIENKQDTFNQWGTLPALGLEYEF